VRSAFLAAYGGGGAIKDRAYGVIVQFVPVTFHPDSDDDLKELARANDLDHGVVTRARWLKNPAARSANQAVAFLEVVLRSPQAANKLIGTGAIIEGKILSTRKLLVEPRQCMKCQTHTQAHSAATCKLRNDICGQCTGSHRTTGCTSETRCCANCPDDQKQGHGASDRSCPTYLRLVERLRTQHPENKYKFFVILEDPKTWEFGNYMPIADPNQFYGPPPARGGGLPGQGHQSGFTGRGFRAPGAATQSNKQRTGPASGNNLIPVPRGRSQQRTPAANARTPTRSSSALRQQTLHSLLPGGILPNGQTNTAPPTAFK
jgi:hypothetical protein